MEEYQKEMKGLALKLIGLMLGSLGLNYEDVKWLKPKNSSRPQTVLQLNSYPVCPDPTRAMGLAPHTDSSLLTLLNQSSISGLQVLVDGIRWVPAHPIPGALVVNVGDLMHILSNGQFKSAAHRAVVNEVHHRISMAYFYGPPMDVKISPLIDHNHPLYQPVTWKEYLDYKATHFEKALEVIRTDAQKLYQRTSDDFAFGQWPNCT
ncbi:gibberellin 3-beta-dioxygenase 3-like [Malus domestica]|uniref:gibberellin 3-beta-dioxygenase 3-like n=1 Tax=Malus domestica TaxID=3750 RepID=UPI00397491EE